jgi:hypothetical protein
MSKVEPQVSEFYQHRYGGIYIVHGISTSTVDKSKVVVYHHVYPFENQMWHRPYDEWCDGRFRKLENDEKYELLKRDREEFQKEITTKKLKEKFLGPKEGDTSVINGKVSDFRNGEWVTVQG